MINKMRFMSTFLLFVTNNFFATGQNISDSVTFDTLGIESKGNESGLNTCVSAGCNDAAKKILANIDSTQNPCENFYNYACGNFIDQSTIPDDKNTFNYITVIKNKVQEDLKKSLESEYNSTEPKIYQVIKTYYNACMQDSFEIKARNLQQLKTFIKLLGGWPVVDGDHWDESAFEWTYVDSTLKRIGFNPQTIFNVYVFNDMRNTSKLLLYVDPFLPYLESHTLSEGFSDPVVSAYEDFFINVARYLGASKKSARRAAKAAISFETKLLRASKSESGKKIKVKTIRDLETHSPGIPWKRYINNLTEPIVHMKRSSKIYVRNPNYFLNVDTLLKETPKKTLANYMLWRFIVEAVPYVNEEMRELKKIFDRESGKEEKTERWQECLNLITGQSGLIVGVSVLYVKEHFDHRARTAITPILHAITRELKEIMANYTWLDETSRVKAVKKGDFMVKVIAYPDELLNEKIINDYVSPLTLYEDNHFQNFLYLNRFHYNFSLRGLLESADSRLWIELSDSTVPNAYYYNIYNAFSVLAAVLQPPVFNPEWPNNALFGSVGFIIGHEIMHAFDLKNILFDESGSYKSWISKEDKKVLESKAKCFQKQYDSFRDDIYDLPVNGRKTLNENIADNLGLKITVGAYKRWLEANGRELGLPGLNYTSEQLFWLSVVSFLCSKKSENQQLDDLLQNAHTPDKFRVNGALQNSHEFSNAFNCSLDSTMNPRNKCVLY